MLHLLRALARKFQFTVRRLLRLFDEYVEDYDPLADEETAEGPTDSGAPARPQLEQAITERTGVRKAKARTMFREKLNQAGVVGKDFHGPRFDLSKNPLMSR